jgi:hypothetical protein
MHQEVLFFERVEDALAAVIDRCGGRKRFAAEMFPDKPPRDAHNLLDAMLNPERRERFSPAQLVYVARRGRAVSCDAVMQYLARELGYADPQPIDPADAEAELQRTFIDAVDRLEAIQRQLGRVQQMRRVV